MIPREELAGLMETTHLLRSARNSHRLFSALRVPCSQESWQKLLAGSTAVLSEGSYNSAQDDILDLRVSNKSYS